MSRALFLILAFFIARHELHAQYSRYLVEFTDKAHNSFSLEQPAQYLSSKAIQRRTRQKLTLDSTDLPVSGYYLDSLSKFPGIEVVSASKWLNSVYIRINDVSALNLLANITFIKKTMPVASIKAPGITVPYQRHFDEVTSHPSRPLLSGTRRAAGMEEYYDYGDAFRQIHMHSGEYLHEKGFTGKGMIIAMLDGGFFGYDTNPALDSIRSGQQILGGYDFVENTKSISKDNTHGSHCLSIIASNSPGRMVGSAPAASFFLLRTENAAEEYPVEEFFWALGAEYADSAGADIISGSLGYIGFDDPSLNHSYANRDGNTSLASIAADLAAAKGMIVCVSAGNSGTASTDERYVAVPADADSVVAIGAVKADGTIAAFSSWGPNAAGKVKPDLLSLGQGTAITNAQGEILFGNGTSFATPNIAGLFACLWQAFPDMTNMELINAVKQSADRYEQPDPERYGYGIPDFRLAYEKLYTLQLQRTLDKILTNSNIKAFPNPFNTSLAVAIKPGESTEAILRLINTKGSVVYEKNITMTPGIPMLVQMDQLKFLPKGIYLLQYLDKKQKQTITVVHQ